MCCINFTSQRICDGNNIIMDHQILFFRHGMFLSGRDSGSPYIKRCCLFDLILYTVISSNCEAVFRYWYEVFLFERKYLRRYLFANLDRKQYPRNMNDVSISSGTDSLFLLQNMILLLPRCIRRWFRSICSFSISNTNSACFLVVQWIIPSSAYLSHGQFGNFLQPTSY